MGAVTSRTSLVLTFSSMTSSLVLTLLSSIPSNATGDEIQLALTISVLLLDQGILDCDRINSVFIDHCHNPTCNSFPTSFS